MSYTSKKIDKRREKRCFQWQGSKQNWMIWYNPWYFLALYVYMPNVQYQQTTEYMGIQKYTQEVNRSTLEVIRTFLYEFHLSV